MTGPHFQARFGTQSRLVMAEISNARVVLGECRLSYPLLVSKETVRFSFHASMDDASQY